MDEQESWAGGYRVIFAAGLPTVALMLIWILALVLFGALGVIGFYQGALRVAFSFIGIIVAALLAIPLSGVFNWVLGLFGPGASLSSRVVQAWSQSRHRCDVSPRCFEVCTVSADAQSGHSSVNGR